MTSWWDGADEEVSAIVLDLGSHSCKARYAGEDQCKCVFPCVKSVSLPLSNLEPTFQWLSECFDLGLDELTSGVLGLWWC
jgi:hypothetical protein